MPITGRAWKYGANVDTDQIIARRYGQLTDAAELSRHVLEDLEGDFAKSMEKGDIIVAGANFGSGSASELAARALKGAGVGAVIATNFARLFYRNAINLGLAIFESPAAAEMIEQGHRVEIDPESGTIRDLETQVVFKSTPSSDFVQMIIAKGGLLPYVQEQLTQRHAGMVGTTALEQKI